MPYDRVKHCKTAEEIKAISRTSLETSQYRLKEIRADEVRFRAISARGLPAEHFTEEFGYREELENQVEVLCSSIISATSKTERAKEKRATPYRNNLFSTAVMIAAASDILLDAYESVRRPTDDSKYRKAAAIVAAILYFQPIRRATRDTPINPALVAVNQDCAFSAANELLQIKPIKKFYYDLASYSRVQEIRNNLSYLKAFEIECSNLIKSDGTILCFSNFPNYEIYNRENDIRWDGIDELERIMNALRSVDLSGFELN